jgi:hypothetical protein
MSTSILSQCDTAFIGELVQVEHSRRSSIRRGASGAPHDGSIPILRLFIHVEKRTIIGAS